LQREQQVGSRCGLYRGETVAPHPAAQGCTTGSFARTLRLGLDMALLHVRRAGDAEPRGEMWEPAPPAGGMVATTCPA
jgi:hypothetical protein